MISRITGTIVSQGEDFVELLCSGIIYKIFVPPFSLGLLTDGGQTELFVYHYWQLTPSRAVPVLIGFLNPVEREFFEMFITVSGIGPRAAVKAFAMPVSEIACAICDGDEKKLCSLPGIGKQKAKQIIAKLQQSAPKFALLKADVPETSDKDEKTGRIFEEAMEILLQLQYKKSEAKAMLAKIENSDRQFSSVEEILDYIYRQG